MLTGADGAGIDAVVLDLVMPDLDGLGVLARIRDAGLTVPVIVQTAHGGIDNVVSAMRAGATDFVVKPVGAERLEVSPAQRARHQGAGKRNPTDQAQPRRHADLQGHRHPQPAHARGAAPGREGGRLRDSGADRRPLRRRQGIDRARHPRHRRTARKAVRRGQLRRHPRQSRRVDPVRPREGRLHRRDRPPYRQVRRGPRRHAVPRRGRRASAGRAGQAPARDPGRRGRAGRRAQAGEGRRAADLRHQPRPHRRREGRPLPRRPVLPPARLSRSACRRWPSGRRTSPSSRATSSRASPPKRASASAGSTPTRWRCCRAYRWPGNVRQLENAVFRAVVLAEGDEIGVADFPQIAALAAAPPGYRSGAGGPRRAIARCRYRRAARRRRWSQEIASSRYHCTAAAAGRLCCRCSMPRARSRPLDELEAEVIRFAVNHYRGQMSEVARRLQIGRSTLYRKLDALGLQPRGRNDTDPGLPVTRGRRVTPPQKIDRIPRDPLRLQSVASVDKLKSFRNRDGAWVDFDSGAVKQRFRDQIRETLQCAAFALTAC